MGLMKIIGKVSKAINAFLDNESIEWEKERKAKEEKRCCENCSCLHHVVIDDEYPSGDPIYAQCSYSGRYFTLKQCDSDIQELCCDNFKKRLF